jgi:hypothetical protein
MHGKGRLIIFFAAEGRAWNGNMESVADPGIFQSLGGL